MRSLKNRHLLCHPWAAFMCYECLSFKWMLSEHCEYSLEEAFGQKYLNQNKVVNSSLLPTCKSFLELPACSRMLLRYS